MNESTLPFYSRHGLHVEIYDAQTQFGYFFQDEDFYRQTAQITGGPVLELGCGTGRLAIPLLETGLEVHGLDASAAMLEVARRKRASLSAGTGERLHLHLGDMSRFELGNRFAFIFIAFRSFQLLTTSEAQRRCLHCVREHLTPNGKVIINIFDPLYHCLLPGPQESTQPPREFVHPVSENRVVVETLERVNDPLTQISQECWRFTEIDATGEIVRQEEESLRLRWTFRYEMRYLIESCGFAVEAEYSDFHRSPPAYGKEQVWVLKTA